MSSAESFLNDVDPTDYDFEPLENDDFELAQGADGHTYSYPKNSPYYRAIHSERCPCKTDPERFW